VKCPERIAGDVGKQVFVPQHAHPANLQARAERNHVESPGPAQLSLLQMAMLANGNDKAEEPARPPRPRWLQTGVTKRVCP
jgi:hypothetical protein